MSNFRHGLAAVVIKFLPSNSQGAIVKKPQAALSGALKREFQKDLELFKHFLLLLNNTGPIRNVELMWTEELDPLKPKFKNRVGTEDALVQLQPAGSDSANRNSPSTMFCDLVHGFGEHEEETCARSDVPAQHRCRATGCTQVYACHVGLTDIAVPVICDNQYLGTLFSGQVLTQPPTPEGFKLVRERLKGQGHINFEELENAYYHVPVVEPAQVKEMVRVLELFARYISNSWKRMQIMAEFQKRHDRELMLDRKELAAILLSGESGSREELNELASRAGLQRLPDRVMALQLTYSEAEISPRTQISKQASLSRLSHAAEEICQNWPNALAIIVRPGELCVFCSLEVRNPSHQRISLQEIAHSISTAITTQCGAWVRIGISEARAHPAELVQAYQEACAALDGSRDNICFFDCPDHQPDRPTEALGRLVKAIQQGHGLAPTLRDFLAQAMPPNSSTSKLRESQAFLTWAIEHLALETISLGARQDQISSAKQHAISGVLHAPNPFAACDTFRRYTELLSQKLTSIFSQRENKIVTMISEVVENHGPAKVTIKDLAGALHLSTGHLSRTFRRTTGMTLEGFLIQQRVELAKKTLLDPRLNVAEVAERCGFCNPAYFASVFKKYVKCTPREFAAQPQRWDPLSVSPFSTLNNEAAVS
ncbi:MAG TPA: PocR ligand-binding domain-containing protein [Terriglobales bacterium]|jgi:AraC-like DNA-binding protein/ligand-binding sensor protein